MTGLPLLAAGFIIKVVAVLFVICAVVLILVVLLQKGRGGGLSAAFAGGIASGILGSKTGDFLTWVTIVLVSVFLILAVVLAKFYKPTPTAEFDMGQPARQAQPVQPLPEDIEQPMEEIPSVAPDVGSGGDVNLPGG
jgi:preprotein translocase subunit SecG